MKQALITLFSIFIYCSTLNGAQAQTPITAISAHDVIQSLNKSIYKEGELSGGNDARWSELEANALIQLRRLAQENPDSLTQLNDSGATPLILAARSGLKHLVAELLKHKSVLATLLHKDRSGLAAHDHALLAVQQTLQACTPEISNPFLLVPFIVKQPYYADRAPYPEIATALREAGAEPSSDSAKQYWLNTCTAAPPAARAQVEKTEDLTATLILLQQQVNFQQRRAEVEASVEILREISAPQIAKGRMTYSELQDAIHALYRDAGLPLPN